MRLDPDHYATPEGAAEWLALSVEAYLAADRAFRDAPPGQRGVEDKRRSRRIKRLHNALAHYRELVPPA